MDDVREIQRGDRLSRFDKPNGFGFQIPIDVISPADRAHPMALKLHYTKPNRRHANRMSNLRRRCSSDMEVMEVRKRYWLLIALLLGSCVGRTITPPAIPGLVSVPEAIPCTALVVDEDAAWAALGSLNLFFPYPKSELVRIDLDSNRVSVRVRNFDPDTFLFSLLGPDIELGLGALWVARGTGGKDESVIWKLDSKSGKIVGELRSTKPSIVRFALGERAVWTTNHDTRTLLRFDPETAQLSSSIKLHNAGLDVAVTDGAVWILHPDATVSRIDPSTNRVLGAVRLPDTYSILATGSNVIWLATRSSFWSSGLGDKPLSSGAELARLDPGENRIVERIPLGEDLGRVVVGDIVVGEDTVLGQLDCHSPERKPRLGTPALAGRD